MSSVYTVKEGMSINDVVLNATGSLINLDAVLTANNFTNWTLNLFAGQQIIIPNGVTIDYNVTKQLAEYEAVNNLTSGILNEINDVFNTIPLWILQTGEWNINGLWTLNGLWITS
jgi:hypothetical protein